LKRRKKTVAWTGGGYERYFFYGGRKGYETDSKGSLEEEVSEGARIVLGGGEGRNLLTGTRERRKGWKVAEKTFFTGGRRKCLESCKKGERPKRKSTPASER